MPPCCPQKTPFVPAFGFPNCGPGLSILPALHRAESLEAKVSLKAVVGGVGRAPEAQPAAVHNLHALASDPEASCLEQPGG